MGRGHEQRRHEILVLHRHARTALAAAVLGAIGRERGALHIAAMGQGDDHVLPRDQVFILDPQITLDDSRAPLDAEAGLGVQKLVADDVADAGRAAQNVQ